MLNHLHAFLYLIEGEQMPPDADDEWFAPRPDPAIRTRDQVETFQTHATALIADLETLTTEEEFQTAFYNRAKLAFGEDRTSIKIFFQMLYVLLFHRSHGPRWGQFVACIGKEEFCTMLTQRLNNPLG